MTIAVSCVCGQAYSVGVELAGLEAPCPECGAPVRVPELDRRPQADPAFDRDKFLLRRKFMAINGKCCICDEAGQPILFAHRPMHFMRHLAAALASFAILGIVSATLFAIFTIGEQFQSKSLAIAIFAAGSATMWTLGYLVLRIILKKRHVTVYRDDTMTEILVNIIAEKTYAPINPRYTVADAEGVCLARLSKNRLFDLFRERWYVNGPEGELLYTVKEDSLPRALLRRWIGPLIGVMRANFIIVPGDGRNDEAIGEFDTQRTLLDLTRDPSRKLDRRLALAIGIMLPASPVDALLS